MSNLTLLISRLEDMTIETIESIDSITYEELEVFVETRGELCAALLNESNANGGLSEEQKANLKSVLSKDCIIIDRMESLKGDASDWLFRNQQIKNGKQAYNADFDYESMFVDYKK